MPNNEEKLRPHYLNGIEFTMKFGQKFLEGIVYMWAFRVQIIIYFLASPPLD